MLQFDQKVAAAAQRSVAAAATTPVPRAVNSADVWLVENQLSRARVRGHEFVSDEPEDRGGTDAGPSPLEYLLAGLGFCQEVMIARNAASRGVRLDDARITVRGYFDRRGGRVEGVENNGFDEIRLDVSFDSPEDPETILDLQQAADRHCYALNTLRRAAVIRQTVTLNGERINECHYDAGHAP